MIDNQIKELLIGNASLIMVGPLCDVDLNNELHSWVDNYELGEQIARTTLFHVDERGERAVWEGYIDDQFFHVAANVGETSVAVTELTVAWT